MRGKKREFLLCIKHFLPNKQKIQYIQVFFPLLLLFHLICLYLNRNVSPNNILIFTFSFQIFLHFIPKILFFLPRVFLFSYLVSRQVLTRSFLGVNEKNMNFSHFKKLLHSASFLSFHNHSFIRKNYSKRKVKLENQLVNNFFLSFIKPKLIKNSRYRFIPEPTEFVVPTHPK